MPKPLIRLAIVVLLLAIAGPVQAGRDRRATDTLITLERPGCGGPCPRYQVSIDALGAVVYEGRGFVAAAGRQTDQVSPADVDTLLRLADEGGLWKIRAEHRFVHAGDGSLTAGSDRIPARVSIQHEGRLKTVEDVPGAPDIVRHVARAIDRLARTARWTGAAEGAGEPVADARRASAPPAIPRVPNTAPAAAASTPGDERATLADAVRRDDVEAVKALLARGIDPNAREEATGQTPLTMVRSLDAARALLNAGASAFRGNARGETPLGWAVTLKPEIVAVLLKSGATADQPHDADGRTPLWTAACVGNASAVALLLAAGANPAIVTSSGVSASSCAERERGKTVNASGLDRVSPEPFHPDYDRVLFLLESNASGSTALAR